MMRKKEENVLGTRLRTCSKKSVKTICGAIIFLGSVRICCGNDVCLPWGAKELSSENVSRWCGVSTVGIKTDAEG